jgi:1,4-dihydroxy-2-naphthoate octaprenyltransferase
MGIGIGRVYLILWTVSLVMGYAYSGPPFKFKDKPVCDILSNALGYGIVNFAVGWTISADLSLTILPHAGLYALAVGAVFLNTTVPDIPGDRSAGKRTTGVLMGKRNTLVLSALLFISTLILSLVIKDLIVTVASLAGAFLSLFSIFTENDLFPKLSYRIPAGVFVLFVSLRYPPLLVLGVITAISMRIYYKRRFGLAYPSITGK